MGIPALEIFHPTALYSSGSPGQRQASFRPCWNLCRHLSENKLMTSGRLEDAGRCWKATFESSLITIHSLRKLTTMTFRGWALQKWMSKKAKWMSKRHQTCPATQRNQAELPHQAVPALFSPHDFHQMQVRNNPDIAINWCMWYTKMTIPWMTLIISGNVLPEPPQILAWVSSRHLCTWKVPIFDFTWDLGRDLLGPLGRRKRQNEELRHEELKLFSSAHPSSAACTDQSWQTSNDI